MRSDIQLKVNGQVANAYLAAPDGGGPGVLVLHAWWGLKPFFKLVCDRLAEQGFTALAPDLYQGRIATTIDEAKAFMEQNNFELMGDTVEAAVKNLKAQTGGPLGVIGFSMGSAWALVVAANEPDVDATVLFYGVGGEDAKQIQSAILGHFAEMDEWEPLEGVRAMEADMKAADLDVTIHVYPNASHWFVEEDRPEFDAASSALAWQRTYEFLKQNLK